jgi:hypothetical protein
MRLKVIVYCKDCQKPFLKRKDSINEWGGRCKSCSNKEVGNRPEQLETRRLTGINNLKKYGSIKNAVVFKKGECSKEKSPTWKGGAPKCLDCGVQLKRYKSKRCVKCSGKNKRGVKRPLSLVLKLRANSPKGENHWNWNGGSSSKNTLIRMSSEYRQWRNEVFERDNYTCQKCGIRSGCGIEVKLNADHVKPFSTHPGLRFEVGNGITLCVDCHKQTDTFGWRLSNRIKKSDNSNLAHPSK